MLLRQDEGGTGLALGIQRVESLVQPLVRGLPCVDGTAAPGVPLPLLLVRLSHRRPPPPLASDRLLSPAVRRSGARTNVPR